MPRSITQYRVFIGSPRGLEAEREQFRKAFDKFNAVNCKHHDLLFEAVGWEDTLAGKGRPQAKINADLEGCDYAIFVFHNRWGSKTGNGNLVGTEEEWEIAQRLYADYKIRAMALYFKDIPEAQRKDPGDELKKVLAFKEKISSEKQHLWDKFTNAKQFGNAVEKHLAEWLAQHLRPADANAFATVTTPPTEDTLPKESSTPTPDFDFWMREAQAAALGDPADHDAALIFIDKAMPLAGEDAQREEALALRGKTLYLIGRFPEALGSFDQQIKLLTHLSIADVDTQMAMALRNKGFTLGALDRGAEAVAVYDDLIARFGDSDVAAIQEQVANALVNKGVALSALDLGTEEIATYDDLIARFGDSDLVAFQVAVARALGNKGIALGELDLEAEAIAVYDDMIARFGDSDVLALQSLVANALFNKSCALAKLRRVEDCITTLNQWADKRGGFDCAMIANDSDFDPIRTDPAFITYLKSKGCDPAAD